MGDYPFFDGTWQGIAKAAVFIAAWTTVTTRQGMHDLTKTAGRIRLKGTAARNRISAVAEAIEGKREN